MSVRYRSAAVAGVNVAYREAGDPANPALLLLHGSPASSFMYRRLLAVLADRFHLVAPDVQNRSAYEEGFTGVWDALRQALWHDRTPATGEPLPAFLEPDGVKWIYTEGTRDPERISPELEDHSDEIAGLIRAFHTTRAEPSPTAPDRRRRRLDHPAASLGGRRP